MRIINTITLLFICADLSAQININNNATLYVGSGASVVMTGYMANSGNITGDGTAILKGSSQQAINGTGNINNLTLNNSFGAVIASSATMQNIYGTLIVSAGTLTTNANLTIKSNASGTARVGNSAGPISGDVSVERFIPANIHQAWRFLSVPTTGSQSINTAWQNGQNPGVPGPAQLGATITSSVANAVALGFDARTNNSSLLSFNTGTQTWQGVNTSTTLANSLATDKGYMLYIWGDRTVFPSSTPNTTTLSTKGPLKQGTYPSSPITIPDEGYEAIGNPYASAIDFKNVLKTGDLDATFYVWDPKLTGAYGLGAYQTCTWNGTDNYIITPGGGSYGSIGSVMNTIQSGQAFFVHGSEGGGPGTIQFNENSKTTGSAIVFRISNEPEMMATRLYAVTATGNQLADGVLNMYDDNFTNAINGNDAKKLSNFGESLMTTRDGYSIASEQRTIIGSTDTIYYKMAKLKQQQYQFEFIASSLDHPALLGKLVDSFLLTEIPINLDGTTTYDFSITADPASMAATRFKLVYYKQGPLPVTFTSIKAYQYGDDVSVEWNVSNQLDIRKYEVMRSSDGINFSTLAAVDAKVSNSIDIAYNWLDKDPVVGDNYYRVRSIGIGGEIKYTGIVKVKITGNADLVTYPNPVLNGLFSLQFKNMEKGIYQARLINTIGQIVFKTQLIHNGGNATQTIKLSNVAPGNYKLEIISPQNKSIIKSINVSN